MPKDEQADGWKQKESDHAFPSQPGAHGAGDGSIHVARVARQLGVLTVQSMVTARKDARKQGEETADSHGYLGLAKPYGMPPASAADRRMVYTFRGLQTNVRALA